MVLVVDFVGWLMALPVLSSVVVCWFWFLFVVGCWLPLFRVMLATLVVVGGCSCGSGFFVFYVSGCCVFVGFWCRFCAGVWLNGVCVFGYSVLCVLLVFYEFPVVV